MDPDRQKEINDKLITAAGQGYTAEIKRFLAAGADVNARDVYGMTALHGAAYWGHGVCVQLLIVSGADVNIKDNNKCTPLIKAVRLNNDTGLAKQLIAAGADINAQDKDGWTPLHCAAYWGHTDAMRLFIEAGADVNIRNCRGETPADTLKKEHIKLYSDHIDELMSVIPEARRLETEDLAKPADTGFEFDI